MGNLTLLVYIAVRNNLYLVIVWSVTPSKSCRFFMMTWQISDTEQLVIIPFSINHVTTTFVKSDAVLDHFLVVVDGEGKRFRSMRSRFDRLNHELVFLFLANFKISQMITHVATRIQDSKLPAVNTAVMPIAKAPISIRRSFQY